ncbi:TPA: hypothetical protein ACVQMW_004136 [Yersinia enterocolitica]|uniref:HEPN domain-containing protein n=1 Tax=Yersinia mollaretii TaxID=33060 RepID=A0AA36PNT3_YERMO|nr:MULTISPECIES: hypothetical protein [Yersinia]EKN3576272.1 hypothetical protein [Yersinia enterocolitica]EKN3580328.1 hypothetical protein [Yersinia enterocolitica]EKN4819475.1 hypothetical protein [Yersinia enterocolitica]EKN4836499.1 hypothetical protein [Yersinia enterocolitica]EKN4936970.1 hypothetical protein [Yersinia enterocolitica]
MAVNYDCFMELAKTSMTNSGEQWTRNAVSRAYYCMFHSALRVVNGNVPSHDKEGYKLSGGTHARFFDYLCDGAAAKDYQLDPVVLKKLGLKLKASHYQRVIADYKLHLKVNKITAQILIKDAEEVEKIVSEITNSEN